MTLELDEQTELRLWKAMGTDVKQRPGNDWDNEDLDDVSERR